MARPSGSAVSRAAILLVAQIVVLAAGCALAPQIHFDATSAPRIPPLPAEADDEELIGLALSGGGSRAAVFSAAGMEALAEHGMLQRVDFVSSVSGGSMAAAYYAKKTAVDGESPEDQAFFERFQQAMRYGFQGSVGARQFKKFRWFSPSRRATSFMEVLDEQFLEGVTLAAVRGLRPRLLINATAYDNGRRFVFTTLPHDEVAFDFERLQGTGRGLAAHPAIRPMTFADEGILGGVPSELPLSLAVAASAGVPLLIGPVSIQVDERYWHLGDGGLYDNTGIETLEQLFAQLRGPGSPAGADLILSFDSISYADEEELSRDRKFGVSRHAEFIVDIPTARAEAYRDAAWRAIRVEQGDHGAETIVMRHTEADLDPTSLPDSCREVDGLCAEERCRPAIRSHIRKMPTRLSIKVCDADLIELAAHIVVHEALGERFPRVRGCRFAAPVRPDLEEASRAGSVFPMK